MRTQKQMKELKEIVLNELQQGANECGFVIFNHVRYARDNGSVGEKTIRRITQELEDDGKIIHHGRAFSKKVASGNIGVIYEIKQSAQNTESKSVCGSNAKKENDKDLYMAAIAILANRALNREVVE